MLNNWDAAMWFRFGTLIAAVLTALGVLLGVWLAWSDGREHDARLESIEMLAKQNTKGDCRKTRIRMLGMRTNRENQVSFCRLSAQIGRI